MTKTCKYIGGIILVCGLILPAQAGVVGDIKVCYNCSTNFGTVGVQDGPTFLIENTSATAITGIQFTAAGDTYSIATIPGFSNAILEPGISSDGGTHLTGAFWHVTGSILDTSESGPNLNTTQFSLTALQGATSIVSNDLCTVNGSTFTPACTAGPSNDGFAAATNFLGIADDPCNNCFGPAKVANLVTVTVSSGVPEPSTWMLVPAAALAIVLRRSKGRR